MHHLIWRFVDREWFVKGDEERARYIWLLGRALEDSDWRCVAYAVMSNHIHIAAIAGEEPLAHWSRRVNAPFANWMNKQRCRLGPLFADRASDHALGPIAASDLIAYIHNNPVRAHVVGAARDSNWTSTRSYLGLAARPPWLHVEAGLEFARMNPDELDDRASQMTTKLPLIDVKRVAKAAKARGSIHLATPSATSVSLVIRPYGRVIPDPRRLIQLVAANLDITVDVVASRRKHPVTRRARMIAVHAGNLAGLTGSAIAAALAISQQAVSRITRHTEAPPESERIYEMLMAET